MSGHSIPHLTDGMGSNETSGGRAALRRGRMESRPGLAMVGRAVPGEPPSPLQPSSRKKVRTTL